MQNENKTVVFTVLLLATTLLNAHQPKLNFDGGSLDHPTEVTDPEISKAYYCDLNGTPEYFKIESDSEFYLNISLLAPNIEGARSDFIIEIYQSGELIQTLKKDEWGKFYEPYAGDDYLVGPKYQQEQSAPGTYLIKVSSPSNSGKYSLAIGKTESFPPIERIKSLITMPQVKQKFFNKSPLEAFTSKSTRKYVSIFMIGLFVILIGASLLIQKSVRKRKSKDN